MNTPLTYDTLLAEIERDLHFLSLKYKHLADVEDLKQEARLLIWQLWEKIVSTANPVQYAKGVGYNAMRKYVRQRSVNTESLEAYLLWQDDGGQVVQRDIPDMPNPKRLSSKGTRHTILSALDRLSQKQRRAVMAFYRIEDRQGRVSEARKTRLEQQARYRGVARLHQVMIQ